MREQSQKLYGKIEEAEGSMLEQQSIVISYESKPNLVTLKVPGKWMLISPNMCFLL